MPRPRPLQQPAPRPDTAIAPLAETGERPIVEVSARDPWWSAKPFADRYEGRNVLGRLWMELRQQLRQDDPAARSRAWPGRIHVGGLAGGAGVLQASRRIS